MAFPAGATVAGITKFAFDAIPIIRMGVNPQSADGAMTGQTDIALRMAGLTSHQILPCLAGVAI